MIEFDGDRTLHRISPIPPIHLTIDFQRFVPGNHEMQSDVNVMNN
jgi:hypothetical protein